MSMPAIKNTKRKSNKRPPLVLAVLDGWGLAKEGPYNAITQAKTPALDRIWENNPHTVHCDDEQTAYYSAPPPHRIL